MLFQGILIKKIPRILKDMWPNLGPIWIIWYTVAWRVLYHGTSQSRPLQISTTINSQVKTTLKRRVIPVPIPKQLRTTFQLIIPPLLRATSVWCVTTTTPPHLLIFVSLHSFQYDVPKQQKCKPSVRAKLFILFQDTSCVILIHLHSYSTDWYH